MTYNMNHKVADTSKGRIRVQKLHLTFGRFFVYFNNNKIHTNCIYNIYEQK